MEIDTTTQPREDAMAAASRILEGLAIHPKVSDDQVSYYTAQAMFAEYKPKTKEELRNMVNANPQAFFRYFNKLQTSSDQSEDLRNLTIKVRAEREALIEKNQAIDALAKNDPKLVKKQNVEIKNVVHVVIDELTDHALMPMNKLYTNLGAVLPHQAAKTLMEAKEEIEGMVKRLDLVVMPAIQIPREDIMNKYEEQEPIAEKKEYVAAAGEKRCVMTQVVDLVSSDSDGEVNVGEGKAVTLSERPVKAFKRKKADA